MPDERKIGRFTVSAVTKITARTSGKEYRTVDLIESGTGEVFVGSIPHWFDHLFKPMEQAAADGNEVELELVMRNKVDGGPMVDGATGKQRFNVVGMEGVEKPARSAGAGGGPSREQYARGQALAAYGPLVQAGKIKPQNTAGGAVKMLERWILDGGEVPL